MDFGGLTSHFVRELTKKMAIIYMTKRHEVAKPDDDRPALETELAEFLTPFIDAWTNGEDMGDPEFDACFNCSGVSRLLARRVLAKFGE